MINVGFGLIRTALIRAGPPKDMINVYIYIYIYTFRGVPVRDFWIRSIDPSEGLRSNTSAGGCYGGMLISSAISEGLGAQAAEAGGDVEGPCVP